MKPPLMRAQSAIIPFSVFAFARFEPDLHTQPTEWELSLL